MGRLPAVLALRCTFALLIATPFLVAVPAADAARCRYILGFKALHHQIASVIGACRGDEQYNPGPGGAPGDAFQQTARGTLVWRKADNQVAFTDGYRTILDGPHGLEQRLNSQRFPWEANPDGLPVVADAPTTASQLRRQVASRSATRSAACTTTKASSKARAHRSSRKASRKAARLKTRRRRTVCP